MSSRRVACYARSSKDRHDLSIGVQQLQLAELAASRGWTIVEQFADVVESGKDDDRGGFQQLAAAVKRRDRGWDAVLLLDTSRLARNRYIAVCFEHDCAKHGVEVVYKSIPDSDPLTTMLLKSIMQAWDEYHSLISRQKGLAGMAANVRAGFRAGGRAPFGYRLKQHSTGAIRDGSPVMKSTLEQDERAAAVKEYLKARAAGVSRAYAARSAGIDLPQTTLIGIEWNALTYAGHTVWNVNAERATKGGGYKGGSKRRPRAEWVVNRGTHPALISDAQADAILARLEASSRAGPRRRQDSTALLVGLLRAPDGRPWWSDGPGAYRLGKGRRIAQDELDGAVLASVTDALRTPAFARGLIDGARARSERSSVAGERGRMEKRIAAAGTKIARMMDLAAELADAGPALRQIDALERERKEAQARLVELQGAEAAAKAAAALSESGVQHLLADFAAGLEGTNREQQREALGLILSQIVLDPTSMRCEIHYRIEGSRVASPRGAASTPLTAVAALMLRAA